MLYVTNGKWADFVSKVTESDGDAKAGDRVGVSRTTIYRWRKGRVPSPHYVAKLADAYGLPHEVAYNAAGFIEKEEEDSLAINLAAVPLDDLLQEIKRRAQKG